LEGNGYVRIDPIFDRPMCYVFETARGGAGVIIFGIMLWGVDRGKFSS